MSVSMAIELNYMRHLHIPAIGFKFLFFKPVQHLLAFYLVCIIIYEHKNHHWWYKLFDEEWKIKSVVTEDTDLLCMH